MFIWVRKSYTDISDESIRIAEFSPETEVSELEIVDEVESDLFCFASGRFVPRIVPKK